MNFSVFVSIIRVSMVLTKQGALWCIANLNKYRNNFSKPGGSGWQAMKSPQERLKGFIMPVQQLRAEILVIIYFFLFVLVASQF